MHPQSVHLHPAAACYKPPTNCVSPCHGSITYTAHTPCNASLLLADFKCDRHGRHGSCRTSRRLFSYTTKEYFPPCLQTSDVKGTADMSRMASRLYPSPRFWLAGGCGCVRVRKHPESLHSPAVLFQLSTIVSYSGLHLRSKLLLSV